jgi:F-type H+-transporting ATPase subunit alpha
MRQVAGGMRLDLAQYRELAAFSQFGSDLDKATQARLARGARTVELLKQPQYQPMPVEEQVAVIYAVTKGFVDDIPVDRVRDFERGLLRYLKEQRATILATIKSERALSDDLMRQLNEAIEDFKKTAVF